MFQYIILYISSDVILFHRRWEKAGRENGKINGENMEKAPDQRAEEKKKVRMAARKQEKRQKITWATRNQRKKNCNMQSWERAKPLSPV